MSEGEFSDSRLSRWDDSILFETASDQPEDSWDSQPLGLGDLDTDSAQYNGFPDSAESSDSDSSVLGAFDWHEAVPGSWRSPPPMLSSSQSSNDRASLDSSMSPASNKSKRSRVPGNPDSLSLASIESALGAICSCQRSGHSQSCMRVFNVGDIYRLRHTRHKMSHSEALQHRNDDLQRAFESGVDSCRVNVEGKVICLQAYCMLYNINWSSARRSWSRLVHGQGRVAIGRPKGSKGGVLSTPQGLQAYAWLKTWIELAGDEDPVGMKYKYTVNYVVPAELYQEYCADYAATKVLQADTPLSCRSFARVWSLFTSKECVRVRRKANTTTKCQG